jgi:hypothetical protein
MIRQARGQGLGGQEDGSGQGPKICGKNVIGHGAENAFLLGRGTALDSHQAGQSTNDHHRHIRRHWKVDFDIFIECWHWNNSS